MIPYNIPYISGNEISIYNDIYDNRKFSGGGKYTDYVNILLEDIYKVKNVLTTSCTDALEMASILFNIQKDDEVILPSYTFVSTALPFEMRGAKLVFADSQDYSPHINLNHIRQLITEKTKLIITVNYAGIGKDLIELKHLCKSKNIYLLEDNAQGLGSTYNKQHLGTFGELSTVSFHETKNINCGEGGALIVNDSFFYDRAVILKDKGTNRFAYQEGKVDKYSWVDIGSSYLLSDILAGHLFSQLQMLDVVTNKRRQIYFKYLNDLKCLEHRYLMSEDVNELETNGHIFYMVLDSYEERSKFIAYMLDKGVFCVSHYVSLHSSPYFINKYNGRELVNCDKFSNCLVRLPLYYDLSFEQQEYIIDNIKNYFGV